MITVIKGPVTEFGTPTLQGVFTVKDLKEVYEVDNYDREKGRPGEEAGYQRDPEEARIIALAKSMAKGLVVSTAIVVNYRDSNAPKLSFDEKGVSQINLPKKLWAIDAQHRCRAWLELYENSAEYGLDKKTVGDYKINFTMYWGASIEEEVLTFYNVKHFGKGIKVENRLELDVYLNKQGLATHRKNETLVEVDEIVETLADHKVWKDKIRFANTKTGIVPKSALVQSLNLIFKDPNLQFLTQDEKEKLIIAVWEGVGESYSEIINEDTNPKDWALQKAIGVNIVHRLIPTLYADTQRKNLKIGSQKNQQDLLDSKVWKDYFTNLKKNHSDINDSLKKVNGIEFWKSGKAGAAGKYSSGQGRNTLLETIKIILLEGSNE